MTRCDGRRLGGDRLALRDARRARRKVGIEEIGRRRGLDAARRLHRLVFGIELERDRRSAVDELVEEDLELAARAVDDVAARRRPRAGSSSSRRASCRSISSVNATTASSPTIWIAPAAWCTCMRACLSGVASVGLRLELRERFEAARKRLVDLALHPRQRAEIEFGECVHISCQLAVVS